MAENEVKPTASSKAANFLEKNKKGLVTVLVAAVVILAAYIIFASVNASSNAKNLQKIDEISYALTNGSASLSDEELAGRRTKALEDLAAFVKKGGVSGVRANLLAADNKDFVMRAHAAFNYGRILEEQGKYAEAVEAYAKLNDELPDDTFAKLAKTRIIQIKLDGKTE